MEPEVQKVDPVRLIVSPGGLHQFGPFLIGCGLVLIAGLAVHRFCLGVTGAVVMWLLLAVVAGWVKLRTLGRLWSRHGISVEDALRQAMDARYFAVMVPVFVLAVVLIHLLTTWGKGAYLVGLLVMLYGTIAIVFMGAVWRAGLGVVFGAVMFAAGLAALFFPQYPFIMLGAGAGIPLVIFGVLARVCTRGAAGS
jgi:hypothetical protein